MSNISPNVQLITSLDNAELEITAENYGAKSLASLLLVIALGAAGCQSGRIAQPTQQPLSTPLVATAVVPTTPPVETITTFDQAIADFAKQPHHQNYALNNVAGDGNEIYGRIKSIVDKIPKTNDRVAVIEHGDGTRTNVLLPVSGKQMLYDGGQLIKEKPGTIGIQAGEPQGVRLDTQTILGLRVMLPQIVAAYNQLYPQTGAAIANRETYVVFVSEGDPLSMINPGNALLLEAGESADKTKYLILSGGPTTVIGSGSNGAKFAFSQATYANNLFNGIPGRLSSSAINQGQFTELLQAWTTTADNDGVLKEQMNNDLGLLLRTIAEGQTYEQYTATVCEENQKETQLGLKYNTLPQDFYQLIAGSESILGYPVISAK